MVVEVAGGQVGDPADTLAVEQDHAAGHAVTRRHGGVVQQASADAPPQLCVGKYVLAAAASAPGNFQRATVAAVGRPDEEVADQKAACLVGGEPPVDVGLGAGGQAGAVRAQPGQQANRGPDIPSRGLELAVRQRPAPGAAPELVQVEPGREAPDDGPLVLVADGSDGLGQPPLEGGQVLIAARQDAVGTQCGARVADCLGRLHGVEHGVGEWPGALAQPRHQLAAAGALEP
ncbi:hypothetical protein ACFWIQ_32460 [Kitasatospora sp. NPDC127059]|uniref:hypothetical protein n=1 Tax=unclassified Kitasatospora TaxID=2633591 RepID=UPI00365625CD